MCFISFIYLFVCFKSVQLKQPNRRRIGVWFRVRGGARGQCMCICDCKQNQTEQEELMKLESCCLFFLSKKFYIADRGMCQRAQIQMKKLVISLYGFFLSYVAVCGLNLLGF